MKIGIFDSGVGGLIITKAIVNKLPQYDYIYLGDTKHVPYGGRSQQAIYQYTLKAVDYLFKKNCKLIIIACNTASAGALHKIQKEYLPKRYPDRRVLGVIVPTMETILTFNDVKRVGVLATQATVNSEIFLQEFKRVNPSIKVFQKAAPLLVPLIEGGTLKEAYPIMDDYLKPLMKHNIDALLLGCTHYPLLKTYLKKVLPKHIKIFSEDEIIPKKLQGYLLRHPEIERVLKKKGNREFLATDLTPHIETLAKRWFGHEISLKVVKL